MHTISGVLSFIDPSKHKNTQGFQNVNFLIKVEKFEDEASQARLFFLDGNPVDECDIPDDIECEEIENGNIRFKRPFFQSRFFMINYPKKYVIKYKGNKIFSLIPEQKRYTIHNHSKPDVLKQYELNNRVRKAREVIAKYERKNDNLKIVKRKDDDNNQAT